MVYPRWNGALFCRFTRHFFTQPLPPTKVSSSAFHFAAANPAESTAAVDSTAQKPVYITTPIFYANGKPHIGHLYTSVLADAVKRTQLLLGREAHLMTGTDEHGQKIQDTAEGQGQNPQSFCDTISQSFRELFSRSGISADSFLRTTEAQHISTATAVWSILQEKGFIFKGLHSGWYSKVDEAFIPESQLIKQEDPVSGKVQLQTEGGHKVEWVSEENYKFKLSQFQEPLTKWLSANPDVIVPKDRYLDAVAEVQAGLEDLSVSRLRSKVHWAIPVPGDAAHSVYVWLDALSVYLTGAGYPSSAEQSGAPLWPANYQILGKDILRFHAIYWPAFLLALDLPLPDKLVVHAHWTVEHRKMSKSLGNVVDPVDLLDQYGVDAVRYFLLREGSIGDDCNYSSWQITKCLNNDLADSLGNLLGRCTAKSMLPDRVIPECGALQPEDHKLLAAINQLNETVPQLYADLRFNVALEQIFAVIHVLNKYFQDQQPWVLRKSCKREDVKRHATVMYLALEGVRVLVTLLQPVIPSSASNALDALRIPHSQRLLHLAKFNACGNRAGITFETVSGLYKKVKVEEEDKPVKPAKTKNK